MEVVAGQVQVFGAGRIIQRAQHAPDPLDVLHAQSAALSTLEKDAERLAAKAADHAGIIWDGKSGASSITLRSHGRPEGYLPTLSLMSYAHLKKGRGGRAPFQILADYVSENWPPDADPFKQYALAFKGARQLTWSGKIRHMFSEAQAETAKKLYRNDDISGLICTIDEHTMRLIDATDIRELALDAADERGLEGVIWHFSQMGWGFRACTQFNSCVGAAALVPLLSLHCCLTDVNLDAPAVALRTQL